MVPPSSNSPPSLGNGLAGCCLRKPAQEPDTVVSSALDSGCHSRQRLLQVTDASDGSPGMGTTQKASGLILQAVLTFSKGRGLSVYVTVQCACS